MPITTTLYIPPLTDFAPGDKKPEEPSGLREPEERAASEPATTEGEDEPPETTETSEHTSLLTHPSQEGKCDQVNVVNHVYVSMRKLRWPARHLMLKVDGMTVLEHMRFGSGQGRVGSI